MACVAAYRSRTVDAMFSNFKNLVDQPHESSAGRTNGLYNAARKADSRPKGTDAHRQLLSSLRRPTNRSAPSPCKASSPRSRRRPLPRKADRTPGPNAGRPWQLGQALPGSPRRRTKDLQPCFLEDLNSSEVFEEARIPAGSGCHTSEEGLAFLRSFRAVGAIVALAVARLRMMHDAQKSMMTTDILVHCRFHLHMDRRRLAGSAVVAHVPSCALYVAEASLHCAICAEGSRRAKPLQMYSVLLRLR